MDFGFDQDKMNRGQTYVYDIIKTDYLRANVGSYRGVWR